MEWIEVLQKAFVTDLLTNFFSLKIVFFLPFPTTLLWKKNLAIYNAIINVKIQLGQYQETWWKRPGNTELISSGAFNTRHKHTNHETPDVI